MFVIKALLFKKKNEVNAMLCGDYGRLMLHFTERVEQECILTATGIDYAGKTNVTASGKNCLPWKNS